MALTPPTYALKLPAGFDLSHWEYIPSVAQVAWPAGTAWLSTKATQGTWFTDDTFAVNWRGFRLFFPSMRRTAFHFFEPGNVDDQVNRFCSTVLAEGFDPKVDRPVLDLEYAGTVKGKALADQVHDWLLQVEQRLWTPPIIYSNQYFWSQLLDNGKAPAWTNDYWHWVAWYPYTQYIDGIPWVPNSRLPYGVDPARVMAWQYATSWVVPGIPSDYVDVNVISQAYLDGLVPPSGDQFKVTHPGVEWHKLRRYNADVYVQVIDLALNQLSVRAGFKTVSGAVKDAGAIVGFNGGGWYEGTSISNVVLVSEGKVVQNDPLDGRPFIACDKSSSRLWFGQGEAPNLQGVWNAWGFDRWVGKDGVYNSAITDQTKDARTCVGVRSDGKLVILVADGRSSVSAGLSFYEAWSIMRHEFGCITVGNGDGGDSSTGVDTALSGYPYNNPGEGFENNVLDQVLIIPRGGQVAYRYNAISLTFSMSLRTDHNVYAPKLETIPAGTRVEGDEVWVAPADGTYVHKGDTWLHVRSIGGRIVDGWVAIIHLGATYMTLTDTGVTPPPAPVLTHTVDVYSDGSIKIDGIPYP